MRKADEILYDTKTIGDAIRLAQDEAWNEAIEAAVKHATATLKSSGIQPSGKSDYIGVKGKLYFMPFVEIESILKLKR